MSDDPDYAADAGPIAIEWLALGEAERIAAVESAHERHRWPVGKNARVHAAMQQRR